VLHQAEEYTAILASDVGQYAAQDGANLVRLCTVRSGIAALLLALVQCVCTGWQWLAACIEPFGHVLVVVCRRNQAGRQAKSRQTTGRQAGNSKAAMFQSLTELPAYTAVGQAVTSDTMRVCGLMVAPGDGCCRSPAVHMLLQPATSPLTGMSPMCVCFQTLLAHRNSA
jgi:hypothetical protein